jgi:XTP/dITP diphosphohydrolase
MNSFRAAENVLVIATRNEHKVGEIRALLGAGFKCLSLKELPPTPPVVEDAPTFAGNATKKAVQIAEVLADGHILADGRSAGQIYVLADDSGLEVDKLGGAPGVQSARFAALDLPGAGNGGNSADAENNAKLLRLLKDVPAAERTARFRCVLALTALPEPARAGSPVCYASEAEFQTELFEGVCEGRIDFAPAGEGGFGYDPLFIPRGYDRSFAELGEEVKNQISHRSQALRKLRARMERAG